MSDAFREASINTHYAFAAAAIALSETLEQRGVFVPADTCVTAANRMLAAADYVTRRAQLESALENAQAIISRTNKLRIMPRSLEPLIDPVVHTPAKVRAYLRADGWSQVQWIPEFTQWENDSLPGALVTFYNESGWSDYAFRATELVVKLAGLLEVGELQVLSDITAATTPSREAGEVDTHREDDSA